MRQLPLSLMLCAGFSLLLIGAAPDDATQEKPPPPPLRITYDVTDLVHVPQVDPETTSVVPPTEITSSPPAQNGRTGTRSQRRDETNTERMGVLTKLIQESIDPTIWAEAGGSEGHIYLFETRMIIVAPESVHDKIVQLFADLRRLDNRAVRVSAIWAALTNDELKSVVVADSSKDASGARVVDLPAIEKIKGAVRQHAEINAISGQRVNITAGRARSVLSSLDAVVGNGAAALQPTIDLVLAGAALQITPILSPDGKSILLDLRAVTSRWDAPDAPSIKIPIPVASTQSSTPAGGTIPATATTAVVTEVERLNMPVHHMTTITRIPTGKAALIGGMTTDASDKEARQLYLIIEAVGAK